ncbi:MULTISPECIES: DUF3310 domain-containing protein [unclassified Campylobacter]|uniref:DUF3310 domain-containing protein n=1 Tax=unclassified Campylobacter TaxID=2593542 RepID=UPI001BDA6C8F|nr:MULTISPECIES: DUF3310 domain-containing protein [unclassified Campylobacter]MBT0879826.1 DUF3310 domain-containing protein [Campylobacter sp. 2018MI27]MBT0885458.1 DUF3310 domain-containing protein [Campylobacter sp. 2018MI10]
MKLHPLLNPKSPHYGSGKDATIYKMYDKYKQKDLLAWCRINAAKYKARKGKKQGESEQDNQEKYESFYYTALLIDCAKLLNNQLAYRILAGKVTEESLKTKLEYLQNKDFHSVDDRCMLEILEYMARG